MDTKENILNAARELFLEKGYNKTTTRDISRLSGENLGSIVYHYKTKDNIAKLVYDEIIDYLFESIEAYKIADNDLIARFLMDNILAHSKLLKNDAYYSFYVELINSGIIVVDPHKYTFELAKCIVKAYELDINDHDLMIKLTIAKSAELTLTQKKLSGQLEISYLDVNRYYVLTLLLLLGLNKKDVEKSISKCVAKLEPKEIEALK